MQQGVLSKVVVDHRNDDTDFGETQPRRDILRPILQQKTDRVSAFVSMSMEYIGHAVRELVHFPERPRTVLKHQASLFWGLQDVLLEDIGDCDIAALALLHHVQDLNVPPQGSERIVRVVLR